jgi:hypothetical protein
LKGAIMPVLNREQLEALRRQVEEDYKLDLAAIERLQRRFIPQGAPPSSGNAGTANETLGPVLAKPESQPEPQPDELTGTLRAMFSNYRK